MNTRENVAVVDLGYGDAGKGATVDWLCSPAAPSERPSAVVRFNGGPQAGHNVVSQTRSHCFSQWGSGTLRAVPTILSRDVVINPLNAFREGKHLEDVGVLRPLELLTVDPECVVVTPIQQHAQRTSYNHGSCGSGFGYAVLDARGGGLEHTLRACDLLSTRRVVMKLLLQLAAYGTSSRVDLDDVAERYRRFAETVQLREDSHALGEALRRGHVVLEGAQGVLLDETHGFNPYTTWSTCTFENADRLLVDAGTDALHLGVLRTYTVRHGLGPHATESDNDLWRGIREGEVHNVDNEFQGPVRVGPFDLEAHQHAVDACDRVDELAITHRDVYDDLEWTKLGIPCTLSATGPTWQDRTTEVTVDA